MFLFLPNYEGQKDLKNEVQINHQAKFDSTTLHDELTKEKKKIVVKIKIILYHSMHIN